MSGPLRALVRWRIFSLVGMGCLQLFGSQSLAQDTNVDCDLGVVAVVDTSASMSRSDGGLTLLAHVQRALNSVVSNLPPDRWDWGVTKFPGDGSPVYPIQLLTDSSRPALQSAISALQPVGGSSPITEGMYMGSSMLLTVQKPRMLAIATDGYVCEGDTSCSLVRNAAATIKGWGITILTFGYALDSGAQQLMQEIASAGPTGEKLFINAPTGQGLFDSLNSSLMHACNLRAATLRVPDRVVVAQGGSATGVYAAQWQYGETFSGRIDTNSNAGLSSLVMPITEGSLSQGNRTFGSKAAVTLAQNASLGTRWVNFFLMKNDHLLDTKAWEFYVIIFDATMAPLSRTVGCGKMTATLSLTTSSNYSIQAHMRPYVMMPGSQVPIGGFDLDSFSPTIQQGAGVSSTANVRVRRTTASNGFYDVHYVVSAAGKEFRYVYPNVDFRRPWYCFGQ